MTTTREHIERLDGRVWAALTKQAASCAVETALRLGRTPPLALTVVAAMTEDELVARRHRGAAITKRPSLEDRVIEADRLREAAEQQARQAREDERDANAAAKLARNEAAAAANDASTARGEARAARADASRMDQERASAQAAIQQALDEARAQLAGLRADSAAELAAAQGKVRGAEVRLGQRIAERAAEREMSERALEEIRAELARVRADAAADVSAAYEQARAADARSEQRIAERAEERRTAQTAYEELRAELTQVRADAASKIAAVKARAAGEIAAARRDAEAEVAAGLARAAEAVAQARAEAAAANTDQGNQLPAMFVPIPPAGIDAVSEWIQDALANVGEIDYMLEAALTAEADSGHSFDVDAVHALLAVVQTQAVTLSSQLRDLPSRCHTQVQIEAAHGYALAATSAYGNYLQRIAVAVQQLNHRGGEMDSAVVGLVNSMLSAHPWRKQ